MLHGRRRAHVQRRSCPNEPEAVTAGPDGREGGDLAHHWHRESVVRNNPPGPNARRETGTSSSS